MRDLRMSKQRGLAGGLLVGGLVLATGMAGCAAKQQRTIEPTGVAAAGGPAGSTPAGPGGGDSGFVLSRKPVGQGEDGPLLPVHTGELWWAFRANFLGMNDKQVR